MSTGGLKTTHSGSGPLLDGVGEGLADDSCSVSSTSSHTSSQRVRFTSRAILYLERRRLGIKSTVGFRATFTAALLGSSPGADDGFDQRILNDALALAQKFQSELGSDLSRVNPGNPWWHTGNPLNLSAGVSRLRRPWEYIWAVARGASTGAGCSHPEHVVAFADRYMEDYLFKK